MKEKILLVIISIILIIFVSYFIPKENFSFGSTITAKISNVTLELVVADTDKKRTLGLSGLEKFPPQSGGMIFIFDEPDYLSFWMKDMKFPIDIIWFDESKRIVNLEENLSPDTYPQVFTSQVLAKYVLEVPANFVFKNKIKIGDQIYF